MIHFSLKLILILILFYVRGKSKQRESVWNNSEEKFSEKIPFRKMIGNHGSRYNAEMIRIWSQNTGWTPSAKILKVRLTFEILCSLLHPINWHEEWKGSNFRKGQPRSSFTKAVEISLLGVKYFSGRRVSVIN